jgi:hypothetical protein
MLLEAGEALYCAKFTIKVLCLAEVNANNLLRHCKDIVALVWTHLLCATEMEAAHIALFLLEIFSIFKAWNNETLLKESLQQLLQGPNSTESFRYSNYYTFINRRIFAKFADFICSLKETPQHVVNAVIVLDKVKSVFPPTYAIYL